MAIQTIARLLAGSAAVLGSAVAWVTDSPGLSLGSPPLPSNYRELPDPRTIPVYPDSALGHESVIGPGYSAEYGDSFDIMGSGTIEFSRIDTIKGQKGARSDFRGQWGTDDLIFLSRYDGLRYFRLTPLGAFILGEADHYEAREEKPTVSLTVLPNRQIRMDQGELSPDQKLLLESFAEPEAAGLWMLHEARAIQAVEKGARISEFRAFLTADDPQPLPEPVEGFLSAVEERGSACLCKGTALLIECLSPQVAETIAQNSQTRKLCQRTGDRGLVVPVDKEKAFRDALNAIGYGMPQV